MKYNNNLKNKVEGLLHEDDRNRVITLKGINHKDCKVVVMPVPRRMGTGYMGIENLSERAKEEKAFIIEPNTKVLLKHDMTFDLSDEIQRANWQWIQHCPIVVNSFEEAQFIREAQFYVFEEELESNKTVEMAELVHKAQSYIFNDNPQNYLLRADLLGTNLEGASDAVIKQFLVEESKARPEAVINSYESGDIAITLLIKKAKRMGVIQVNPNTNFHTYGFVSIGSSEESAIRWALSYENRDMVEQLKSEVHPNSLVDATPKADPLEIAKVKKAKVEAAKAESEKDAEITELKAKLAQVEEDNKTKTTKKSTTKK